MNVDSGPPLVSDGYHDSKESPLPASHQSTLRIRSAALGLVLVVAMAGASMLSATPANGDPIGDLQSRAAEITQQMADLQEQIRASTTAVEKARYRSSQLESEITAKRSQLGTARKKESSARGELRKFALQAYVSGGGGSGGSGLTDVLGVHGDQIGQKQGYVQVSIGDRQQLVDDVQAAQQVTREQRRDLEASQREATAAVRRAETKQAQAQDAASKLAAIKSQLDGQLATLVAEKQAAQARAAEERVRAQVAAQAATAERQSASAREATQAPSAALPPVAASNSNQSNPPPTSSGGPGFVPPPNASAASIAIAAARSQLGVPYSWGGGNASGPSYGIAQGANIRGFDCSGLTLYAYAQAGITLSHLTWDQMKQGRVVPLSQIEPGDLVFYWGGGHMALYIGGGQVIHAPQTGDVVRYGSLYMGTPELVVRPTG